ncbi:MAG: ABC transporter permease [Lachnospiraceae bacterium]|nr:ABC transporter permease [Lachnospiraceae bacterium]
MTENLRSALQGILAHKMRSFLTMLGVIIGIASIIAIVSTIKGTNEQIMKNLIGAGNNNVTIELKQGEDVYYMDAGAPAGVQTVSEDQKEEIRGLPEAVDASFYVARRYADGIAAGEIQLSGGGILGIDSHYLSTGGFLVTEGRPFTEADYKNFNKVMLLDDTAAGTLFPNGGAVGSVVTVRGEPFLVVGLIKKADSFQPVINSFQDYMTYYQESYGTVYVPDACWPIVFQYDEPENCVVRAEKTEDMSSLGRKAQEIMNRSVLTTDGSLAYKAEDLLEKARNKQELASSTNRLLIWVASIALLVGGIGVMNIMLVSVTERTSEIGLKKALGARKKRILLQFLTESAMLTLMGGILGIVVGIVMAEVISKMSQTPVALSIPAMLGAVVFSMVIGIVFGLLPSVKASNLNPIDALRRE